MITYRHENIVVENRTVVGKQRVLQPDLDPQQPVEELRHGHALQRIRRAGAEQTDADNLLP